MVRCRLIQKSNAKGTLLHSVHAYQATESGNLHSAQLEMMPFVEDKLEHAINGYLNFFPTDDMMALKTSKHRNLNGLRGILSVMLDAVGLMGTKP